MTSRTKSEGKLSVRTGRGTRENAGSVEEPVFALMVVGKPSVRIVTDRPFVLMVVRNRNARIAADQRYAPTNDGRQSVENVVGRLFALTGGKNIAVKSAAALVSVSMVVGEWTAKSVRGQESVSMESRKENVKYAMEHPFVFILNVK
jgi:hypothetical protein